MRNSKKLISLLTTLLIFGAMLPASCGGSDDPSGISPALSEELNIYTRFGYLSPEVVNQFESEFGVRVNFETYQDESFMLSVIQSDPGKYDLIFPTESLVAQMIRMKLLSELDLTHIPNLSNIGPEYLNVAYDPANAHSVPFSMGTTGIAYNSIRVTDPVNSWGIFWDADYSGRFSMLNNPRKAIGATLKYLGYPITTSKEEAYAEAKEKLLTQTPLQPRFLDIEETIALLKTGDLWLAQMCSGDALALKDVIPEIEFAIPGEGSDYSIACMAIPAKAVNQQTAEAFINFILRPEVHAENAVFNRYGCPNKATLDSGFIPSDMRNNQGIYPPPLTKIKLDSWDIKPGPADSLYNRTWAEIRLMSPGSSTN